MRLCTVEGCDRKHYAKTWCNLHYYRMRNTGSLEPRTQKKPTRVARPIEHGTDYAYTFHHCRCADCKRSHLAYGRAYNEQRKYGLKPGQYEAMLSTQGGVCGICGEPPAGERLCVDHDHDSGEVRGLLCTPCNQGIGFLRDDIDRLMSAAAYLLRGVNMLEERS